MKLHLGSFALSKLALLGLLVWGLTFGLPGHVLPALTATAASQAQNQAPAPALLAIPISVFVRADCKHCQDEKAFLAELQKTEPNLQIIYHDLAIAEGKRLFDQLTSLDKISKVTPITLVGNVVIQGFDTANTTGKRIKDLIVESRKLGKPTLTATAYIAQGGSGKVESVEGGTCDDSSTTCALTGGPKELLVNIPFVGAIDLFDYSLPTLSVILGFVDGFNPCAMWVLLMFLIILIEVGSRKRMFQVAGIFIAAEAIMYYLILNIWFTTWDFIGLNKVVTPIVGLVAIGGGLFFLYEFCQKDASCKVISPLRMAKTKQRISALAQAEMSFLVILGILGLAFSVNIFEFACSIGIPQAFTKVIELNNVSWLQQQFLMGLYILFYMVDDVIVFGIALYSFEKLGVTKHYVKASNLIGGILMLILGSILIFNPSLLVFY